MDAEVDSAWICTQAVVSTDSQSDNEQEKINNYGCIVLNDMIDNGRYVLKEGDNTIGRHPLNHIYIDHPSVSMNHAVIQCDSDGVVLLDKGSLNKTKLNKKTLRKDVAYFLEENALLVFGEVRAHYFMNEGSNEFTNDTKSMAPDNTSVHEATQNDGVSLSKLSNAVITLKSVSTDIPNAITNCNLSLVIENNSSCKIEREVPKTVTGTECAMNTLNDLHTKLNSSSPSDEYLLEALSQVEAQHNSKEIVHNLSNEDTPVMNLTESVLGIIREDTPSPVMDLKSSILTTSNVTINQFQSPNKINTEAIREDTPSPVMDLKRSIITTNSIPKPIFQSPSQVNTTLNREDTPSPIMNLGYYNDFANNLETINHDIISTIQSPNKVDEFDNTQVLEIDNNIVQLNTQTSNNNEHKRIVNTFEADDDDDVFRNFIENECNQDYFNCLTQKISINKNIDSKSKLCPSIHEETQIPSEFKKLIKTDTITSKIHSTNVNEENTQVTEMEDDFFNCPTQKVSITKKIKPKPKVSTSIHDKETQEPLELSKPCKTNSILSKSYSTGKHEENTQIPEMDDNFFNCPTQKVSISKKIQPKPKISSSIHDKETQEPVEFSKPCKTNSILSKSYSTSIHEENTQVTEMEDDFFNCPTQKLSVAKKIQPKPKVSSIHEKETQIPSELKKLNKTDTINSTNVHEVNTQVPEMEDDFFNCPTQKLSITKKIQPKPKVSPSTHGKETQELSEFSKPCNTNSILSKSYSTGKHEENTQVSEMEEDFFNCPTQKLSITKKIQPKPKVSTSIHDKETQEPLEFSKPCKTNSILSKSYSTTIHEENTQVPEMEDDFFNCPTQKVSIIKNIQPKPKISSSIHDKETQEPLEFSKPCNTNSILSKSYSASIHEENTQVPVMEDDFFNCPTQKVSITKKIQPKPKVSTSIHDKETQEPLEFSKPCKTNSILSKSFSASIHEENTQVPEMEDDFFNCPTQKVSITKKIQPKPKISSSIHDKETQEPLEFSKPCKTNSILSKSYSASIHEENTQVPEMEDDFFNCPTQKVSITKKIQPKPKVSTSIHDKETQEPLEFSKPCKTNSILSKSYSTSIHEENTQVPEMKDDFFNCPTQKLSIAKKIQPKPKVSSSIHDKETQEPLEFSKPCNTNSILSKSYSTTIHEENTQVPEMEDDFFNCPTQKVSIIKNIQPKPKVSSSIHEKETQIPSELKNLNKTDTINSKIYSTNVHEVNTQVPEMEDDFFNCPTQKVSTTKKIQPKPKVSSSIHEKETQIPSELKNLNKTDTINSKIYSTNVHEVNTQVPEMEDDFFNCPTQKVSITKKIQPKQKISSSIHDKETQEPLEFSKPYNTNSILSKSYSTSIHEESTQIPEMDVDFFNCPTQKLSVTKKILPKPKVSSSIHEGETQILSEFIKLNKTSTVTSKNYSTNKHEDLTQIFEMDDDFSNCPTQKISFTKKINPESNVSSTVQEKGIQKPPEFSQFDKTNNITSNTNSTNLHEDLTAVLKEDNEDFFNCHAQKVSCNENSKISVGCKKHELVPTNINEAETQDTSIQSISKISLRSNRRQNKGNIVNCTTQKVQSNSISNCSININDDVSMNPEHFDRSNNHKQIIKPDKKDRCDIQKSTCIKSNTIRLSNVHLPVNCNEQSSNSLKINKPKIRVREDLHMSYSGDSSNNFINILNKPKNNAELNNINTTVPFDKNFDSPGCSNTTSIKENDLNTSSTKQKHLSNDSVQPQVSISLKNKYQMDESIFSPLNIPDVSANSLLEHHSSPKTTENKLNTLNCEPSTSCNDASKWKSFWNKKKVQSRGKGISDKQKNIKITSEAKENKEQYQTRAITRKRKQNGVVESNKKICSRNKILEPLVENSSEIVVSFSYLKSRHLQEMKQFVDKTGGTVTDDITQCSVLVTDKIRCTMKILSAIARGCPIVNANWLRHSYTVKMFQDLDDFIIVDKDAERKYKFQLKESLAKAKAKKLLDGYNVLVTPSVKPSPQEMKVIITCAGGNYVLNWTTTQYSKELIVTCDKDRTRWKSAWDNESAKIIDSDTLVMSIIRQKLTI